MSRGDITTTGVLNAVAPRVRRIAAPAAGVLLLTSLPFRLLEIHFIDLLVRLRGDALHYGNLLFAVSSLTVVAFIVSLYGRAVFVRACHIPPSSWRELLRVDWRAFAAYVYVALFIQLFLVLFSVTIFAIPFAVLLAGIAAGASTDRPKLGLIAPIRALGPYLRDGRALFGLMIVFGVAFLAVWVDLTFLAQIGLWAAGAVPGFNPTKWMFALSHSQRFRFGMIAATVAVLEPFFLAAMDVYADRVRSRQTGQDLFRRFDMLTRQKALTVAAVLAFIVCVPAHAQVPAADYVRELRIIRDAYASGRFGDAAAESAKADANATVSDGKIRFEPDHALLRAVHDAAAQSKGDVVLVGRLDATISAFAGGSVRATQPRTDPELLKRIANSEKMGELPRGGEVKTISDASPSVSDEIARIFNDVIDWLASKLERLFDWIGKLFPKRRHDKDRQTFLGVPVVVWVVTTLIVATMIFLAVSVLRRSRRRAAAVVSAEAGASDRDADPLSRRSGEWERYAADLAASGRLREAIRAWYHAVLTTLVGAGVLHYRKGVTNWEYVSALSPAFDWRTRFVTITQTFDVQWYGRRDTTPDILDAFAANARAILGALKQAGR